KNMFSRNKDGYPTTMTADKLVSKLSKNGNWLSSSVNEEILGFGFRVNRSFFTFSYRLRMDEYFRFSKDVLALPILGNMNYLGEDHPANLNVRMNMNAYQEISVGAQIEVNKRLYIGVRPKLLFGMANVRTQNASAQLYTDPESYKMKMRYNLEAEMMSIVPLFDQEGSFEPDYDYLLAHWQSGFQNVGSAIDLGVVYRINDHFGVSAAVNDLGFITWKTGGQKITGSISNAGDLYTNGDIVFDGLNFDEIDKLLNDPDYLNAYLKQLGDYFPVERTPLEKYTTALSSKIMVEGYYNFGKNHRVSALFQGRVVNKSFLPAFTLAYNGTFFRIIDVCVNYTMAKHNFANLGLGLGLNLGVFHLYVATDNIIAAVNPLNNTNVNAQVGILFNWGKIQEKKIKEDKIME
ncbi:MAG: DUF5723 family protein, partial [Bacteroidales bacterium]